MLFRFFGLNTTSAAKIWKYKWKVSWEMSLLEIVVSRGLDL